MQHHVCPAMRSQANDGLYLATAHLKFHAARSSLKRHQCVTSCIMHMVYALAYNLHVNCVHSMIQACATEL